MSLSTDLHIIWGKILKHEVNDAYNDGKLPIIVQKHIHATIKEIISFTGRLE